MSMLFDVERSASKPRLLSVLTPSQWRDVRIEATRRAKLQTEGFESSEIFKASIESKLLKVGCDDAWFRNLRRCGRESFFTVCPNCRKAEEKFYQCSNKICPRCNWRIANRRRELLEEITRGMPEKILHVVLTQRNFYDDLSAEIRKSRAALLKLRRNKIFGKISGGCASMEITNEKKGWHVHWHLLVAATGFVPASELALIWGKLVGQEFAIVKIKAVTEGSYLQEVCKYAAKASDIVKWEPSQIEQFVRACKKTRMFTVFGAFKLMRKVAAANVKLNAKEKHVGDCECGCTVKVFGRDEAMCMRQIGEGNF